jgi:hypothetical protein
MANPNIVNVATIVANTYAYVVPYTATNISGSNVVANPSGSNSVYKINSLMVTNNNSILQTVSAELNRAGSNTVFIYKLNVPAQATLALIGKDTSIYLLENDAIQLASSATNTITAICSWEQIS